MVFGNSFAAAFVDSFDALVKDDHYAVTITSSFDASPIGDVPNDTPESRINMDYWHRVVPSMMSQLRSGDWVLLISDLYDLAPPQATARNQRDLELFRQGLRRMAAELARSGVRLAVLDANPFIRDSECLPESALPQWFSPGGGPCRYLTRTATIARRRPIDAMLRGLQREHRLAVIDPFDVFCPGQQCTFLGTGSHVLYRDGYAHPSVEAARDAAPVFRKLLTSGATGQ